MLNIKEYIAPSSIDEAYNLLISKKGGSIIGGGAFLRMASKNISLAIDLSKAKLSYINETASTFEIGGMTTLGEIERSKELGNYFSNMLAVSVKDIVGVQLRNIVTIGATVYSRYGFSDPITALSVLNTSVKLYKEGIIPLDEFLVKGTKEPDILESIIIEKDKSTCSFQAMRNSKGDYAILNLAVSKNENQYKIALGARPQRSTLAVKTMNYLSGKQLLDEEMIEASSIVANEITFGSNNRGSDIYRRHLSKVLLKRALREVIENEN